MPVMIVDCFFGLLAVSIGVAAGWWLRGGRTYQHPDGESHETHHAREILLRLRELAANVAHDVGQHSSRMEEIHEELTSADTQDTDAVMSAVSQLVEANSRMQMQLATADERLREQARLIESHAAEARTDPLTQIANRRAFDDEMLHCSSQFQRAKKPFSVLILDVDHFKSFNDTYGHQAGDAVLQGLANVLSENARDSDLVARYGGEEFSVVMSGTSVADARAGAERLRRAIQASQFEFDGKKLRVTASIGVAEVADGETGAQLIERADAALYASKEAGRNWAHWHDGKQIYPIAREEDEAAANEAPAQQPNERKPVAKPQKTTAKKPAPTNPVSQPAKEHKPAKSPVVETTSHAAAKAKAGTQETPCAAATGAGKSGFERRFCDRENFTGLVEQRLYEWRRGGVSPSVMLVRIDDFSKIVSVYGPEVGKTVLRATSQFLSAAIRDMDMLSEHDVATFAALLPGVPLANVAGIAERLREAIEHCALPVESGKLNFTVSVSGTDARKNDDASKLFTRTEEALDVALRAGGNRSCFCTGDSINPAASLLSPTT